MGMDKPQLKKCFRDEKHALEVFQSELSTNLVELQKHGLFFSFTTDPMLPKTIYLTMMAVCKALQYDVPVKLLTKNAEFLNYSLFKAAGFFDFTIETKSLIAFGFSLTGHDELEKGASTNVERIEVMRNLHNVGFKTFASIEPIVDFEHSSDVIMDSYLYCDLYKIGLMSGKKYDKSELVDFVKNTNEFLFGSKVYWKDTLLKAAGIARENLPSNCVTRDFNLFKNK